MKKKLAFARVIDKIKVPEKYHRGKKLLEMDRKTIRKQYKTGNYSYNDLAKKWDVSFGTIQVIINEQRRVKNLQIAKEYRKRNEKIIKEKKKGKAMELRYYKKSLILEGKIEV